MRTGRKARGEENEHPERWLVSYADFVTLLFAFFVVMYSVSSVNEGKLRVLSDSLLAAFSTREESLAPVQVGEPLRSQYADEVIAVTNPILPQPLLPLSEHGEKAHAAAAPSVDEMSEVDENVESEGEQSPDAEPVGDVDKAAFQIAEALAPLIEEGLVDIRREEHWLEVELKTSILFASGEARLKPSAVTTLTEIAGILTTLPNPVQVEGFTDNVPISTSQFPSNWELSAARAASVVHLFTQNGVNPERMIAIAYGEHRALDSNDTPEGRSRNRRVVLVIPTKEDARRVVDPRRASNLDNDGALAEDSAESQGVPVATPPS